MVWLVEKTNGTRVARVACVRTSFRASVFVWKLSLHASTVLEPAEKSNVCEAQLLFPASKQLKSTRLGERKGVGHVPNIMSTQKKAVRPNSTLY